MERILGGNSIFIGFRYIFTVDSNRVLLGSQIPTGIEFKLYKILGLVKRVCGRDIIDIRIRKLLYIHSAGTKRRLQVGILQVGDFAGCQELCRLIMQT
jgi:hypothetical protein